MHVNTVKYNIQQFVGIDWLSGCLFLVIENIQQSKREKLPMDVQFFHLP